MLASPRRKARATKASATNRHVDDLFECPLAPTAGRTRAPAPVTDMKTTPFLAAALAFFPAFAVPLSAADEKSAPTIEEMIRVSTQRRAAAAARYEAEIDEIFRTIENNPFNNDVSKKARDRLTGDVFAAAVPRLLAGLESSNAGLARSCAIALRTAGSSDASQLPAGVSTKIVEIFKGNSTSAKRNALDIAEVLPS